MTGSLMILTLLNCTILYFFWHQVRCFANVLLDIDEVPGHLLWSFRSSWSRRIDDWLIIDLCVKLDFWGWLLGSKLLLLRIDLPELDFWGVKFFFLEESICLNLTLGSQLLLLRIGFAWTWLSGSQLLLLRRTDLIELDFWGVNFFFLLLILRIWRSVRFGDSDDWLIGDS